mmetsp:Transcript_108562/g.324622  ORF Transcript_108562/g.324622 Transcript_108562/m.324622 type:complete len:228 (-) Transcript_108562:992-1675(-)
MPLGPAKDHSSSSTLRRCSSPCSRRPSSRRRRRSSGRRRRRRSGSCSRALSSPCSRCRRTTSSSKSRCSRSITSSSSSCSSRISSRTPCCSPRTAAAMLRWQRCLGLAFPAGLRPAGGLYPRPRGRLAPRWTCLRSWRPTGASSGTATQAEAPASSAPGRPTPSAARSFEGQPRGRRRRPASAGPWGARSGGLSRTAAQCPRIEGCCRQTRSSWTTAPARPRAAPVQ